MAYSQSIVLAGGLAHIPVVIGFFKFIEKKIGSRLARSK
tara:strand:+ start:343 stop:459 length:117 start_codon:yes stop_codon:yes gene_type:complete